MSVVDQAASRMQDIQVKIHDTCEEAGHRMVADNRGLVHILQGGHTLVLEDTPSAGARKQEEADEQNWKAHTRQLEVHRLLPPVVHNRDCCSVVVGTADHPWGVGLNSYHSAAGNTLRTASRNFHGQVWSCSLRKGADSTNPAVGHVADIHVETHGHHSVAGVKACIADHVHCLFCSPGPSAHMDLKGAAIEVQSAPNVEAMLVAQTLRIRTNSHSSPTLESQCAFSVLDGVLPVLRHGGHGAGQVVHRPTVPLGVCQP